MSDLSNIERIYDEAFAEWWTLDHGVPGDGGKYDYDPNDEAHKYAIAKVWEVALASKSPNWDVIGLAAIQNMTTEEREAAYWAGPGCEEDDHD